MKVFVDIDESKLSREKLDAIEYVTSAGIMSGYADGFFRPFDAVTNGELFSCLYNAFSKYFRKNSLRIHNQPHWARGYANFVRKIAKQNMPNKITDKYLDSHANSYSVALIKIFFDFLVLEEEKGPTSKSDNQITKGDLLTRINLAAAFYWNAKRFSDSITQPKKLTEYSALMQHWKDSPFNPFRFAVDLKKYSPKIIDHNSDITFFSLFDYFIDESFDDAFSLYSYMVDINDMIDKTISAIPADCDSFYQYTTLSSLYLMLTKSNTARSSEIPKISLHMSNVAYLNDPLEGMCFEKKLYNKLESLHLLKEYDPSTDSSMDRIINTKDTYIASFIKSSEERLPMWVQYADNAKGCRIEFKTNEKLKLTSVQYISGDSLPRIIEELIGKASSALSTKKRKYIFEKIREIQYFYKDLYYQHEEEIRYLTTTPVSSALNYESPRENEYFPRLYCPIPEPLEIKSVTLGAKCPNPEQVALFLKKKNVPAVYMSKIHYR